MRMPSRSRNAPTADRLVGTSSLADLPARSVSTAPLRHLSRPAPRAPARRAHRRWMRWTFTTVAAAVSVLVDSSVDHLCTSAANGNPPNAPVRPFTTLEHLGPETDAMPELPPWTSGWISSPDVRRAGGRYVRWSAAPDVHDVLDTGQPAKCLGVAVARVPLGPFVAKPKPVLCGQRGAIDPRTFVAPDGQLWLDRKADVNAGSGPAQNPSLAAGHPTTRWASDRRRTT